MSTEFVGFPKIARYSRDVVVTEKIDGTNAQILIRQDCMPESIAVGSRNRWLTPENDNFGFCKWVHEHIDEILKLGPGRHFGEWWGQGIQRGYGLKERRFSLFNTSLWNYKNIPSCCDVVPVLWQGSFDKLNVDAIMEMLKENGSVAEDGYMNPEGVVIYHTAANVLFKKTFEKDNQGKGN